MRIKSENSYNEVAKCRCKKEHTEELTRILYEAREELERQDKQFKEVRKWQMKK